MKKLLLTTITTAIIATAMMATTLTTATAQPSPPPPPDPAAPVAQQPVANPAPPAAPAAQPRRIAPEKTAISQQFKNIFMFLTTMVDSDNLYRFQFSDYFIQNHCIKRDIFALHTLKTQVVDYVLDNYSTITDSQLRLQKTLYYIYTVEMHFLRNIEMLKNPKGVYAPEDQALFTAFYRKVLDAAPSPPADINQDFDSLITNFTKQYSPSFEDYQTCENSWSGVARKVESIENKATQIAEQSDQLVIQLNRLGQEAANTPENFWNNTTQNITDSFLEGYANSKDSYTEAISSLNKEFEKLDKNRTKILQTKKLEQERLAGLNNFIGESLLTDTDLSTIGSTLSRNNLAYNERLASIQKNIENSYQVDFLDSSTQLLLKNLVDIQAETIKTKEILSAEKVGLISYAKTIRSKQCSER